MFRSNVTRIAQRLSETIDEMLVGDFDFVEADGLTYADVDYFAREDVERPLLCEWRSRTPALSPLTAAAR